MGAHRHLYSLAPFFLLSCATTQVDDWGSSSSTPTTPPPVVEARASEAQPPARSKQAVFLWEASKGDAKVYLFGSIHVGDPSLRLPDVVLRALRRSRTIAFEVDPRDTGDPEKILAMGTSQEESLEEAVSPPEYEKLSLIAAKIGLPMSVVDRLKPWMAGLLFQDVAMSKLGYSAENGIENQIMQYADGRPIISLESVELQVGIFDGMPIELQRELLSEALLDLDEVEKRTGELMKAWKSGDEPTIQALVFKDLEKHPELSATYYDALLFRRNVGMAQKVENMLNGGGQHLVVVGVAHLIGAKGVPALLTKSGAIVKRLQKDSALD